MGWFRRRRGPASDRSANPVDLTHLEQFVQSRRGVEAFIEPATTVTETTVMLVAFDGEWTRRRMPSPQAARQFAQRWSMPIYDVQLVGYPQRKRDYDARRKANGSAA